MKYFFIVLLTSAMLFADEAKEVGRYQLETLVYTSKKGTVYIVETVLDTKTGDVVKRRKKKASLYKLPYKSSKGKMITKE